MSINLEFTPPIPIGREVSWGVALQRLAKRAIDYVGTALGLILLGPLMLLIAVLIRLDSRGPVLFRQERAGLNGRNFRVFKYRTMSLDAEQRLKDLEAHNESAGGVLFKMRDDPRVTRLGKFLRRTSLDELPQLFNVLRGEMSLVGPRPLQIRDCNLLREVDAEGYARRLRVLPGVTGLWQVSGRSEVGFRTMMRLDTDYIERWSLWMDCRIIWQTVIVVLLGKGAY